MSNDKNANNPNKSEMSQVNLYLQDLDELLLDTNDFEKGNGRRKKLLKQFQDLSKGLVDDHNDDKVKELVKKAGEISRISASRAVAAQEIASSVQRIVDAIPKTSIKDKNFIIDQLNIIEGAVAGENLREDPYELIRALVKSNSRFAYRALVRRWIKWIAFHTPHNQLLVELAADQMRLSHEAVLPLINQFKEPLLLDKIKLAHLVYEQCPDEYKKAAKRLFSELIEVDGSKAAEIGIKPDVLSDYEKEEETWKQFLSEEKNYADNEYETDLKKWLTLLSKVSLIGHEEGRPGSQFADNYAGLKNQLQSSEAEEDQTNKQKESSQLGQSRDWKLNMRDLLIEEKHEQRKLIVFRRIASQLEDMSNEKVYQLYGQSLSICYRNRQELHNRALDILQNRLECENDPELLEYLAQTLGNISGREAISAIVRGLVGQKEVRNYRQNLLNKYYLEPSKQRSKWSEEVMQDGLTKASKTMKSIQYVNLITISIGFSLLLVAIISSISPHPSDLKEFTALVGGFGGFIGILKYLISNPLNEIRIAMADLAQTQSIYFDFLFKMNSITAYIQSQYVSQGTLSSNDLKIATQESDLTVKNTLDLIKDYLEKYPEDQIKATDKIKTDSFSTMVSDTSKSIKKSHNELDKDSK